jgi:hypothetical protein
LAAKTTLEAFFKVSGLVVNLSKQSAIPIRCGDLDLANLLAPLGTPIAYLPCKYLGMPLSVFRQPKIDIQPLVDKIAAWLAFCKGELMSRVGQLALLKVV